MLIRTTIVTVCLLATYAFLSHAAKAEPTPIHEPLAGLPLNMGQWKGRAERPLTDEILAVLRVDDYITRTYVNAREGAIGLYVGYHATQRQGASIHSPLNCLPGAGWAPSQHSRVSLDVIANASSSSRRRIEVNRVVIQRGLDQQLVLYWYQSHGRIVASEYWGKVYSVVDAIRYNRTDAALVRIVTPITDTGTDGIEQADRRARDFAVEVFPRLAQHLPN